MQNELNCVDYEKDVIKLSKKGDKFIKEANYNQDQLNDCAHSTDKAFNDSDKPQIGTHQVQIDQKKNQNQSSINQLGEQGISHRDDVSGIESISQAMPYQNSFKDRRESHKDGKWIVNQNIFVKMNEGKNINDFYEMKELLGQGGFGKVYKTIHKSTGLSIFQTKNVKGMVRAMKMIAKDKMKKEDEEKLLIETNIMIQMDHANIVKLFEVFNDESFYYLISEFCDGGELFEKIRHVETLTEKVIASYMKQILSAVMYCHKLGIVHRDLKPENILFDQKKDHATIKIIDFGASAKLSKSGDKLQKRIGTPFYVAPEVLAASYNEKCDIWSLGVILYILLCGYPPFFGNSEFQVLKKVKKGTYTFDTNDWGKVSIQAKDLIRRMLFYDPAQRVSAIEAYNHPWIQNNNSKGQLQNQVLQKLSDFQLKNKLKMAIIEFISVQVMTSHEKEDLMKEFQYLDKNGDGMVSKNELYYAYKKLYKDKFKAMQIVDDIFNDIDANVSGKVDFTEFVAAAMNKEQKLSRIKIEQSFKLFDLDQNGLITRSEIEELFGGNSIDDIMWEDILVECDKNGDGMINQQEFIELLISKINEEAKAPPTEMKRFKTYVADDID